MIKFTCEKALLNSAISTVSRAVPSKSTISSLEGILIKAGDQLSLTGYNLEIGVNTLIPAEVDKIGSLVLPAKLFGDIIRLMPDNVISVSSDDKNIVTIECGEIKYNIVGTEADEYPNMPSINEEKTLYISQKKLSSMIRETIFAVSESDVRPIHTGSKFDVQGNEITVVSVDGYRLAIRKEELSINECGDIEFVVPGNALKEVEKICSDTDDDAAITVGEKHVMFAMGGTTLITRRLEGEFLDYKKAVPRNNPISLIVNKKELQSSIERVSLIIDDRIKTPVRCTFGDGKATFTTNTTIGTATDVCTIEGNGENLEIGFNNRYLLDAIKAAPSEVVKLEMNNGVSPCIIVPAEEKENFLFMVLPVRLR